MTALDWSADLGLTAVVLATLNVCIGLLIWARYSPWREWPHRRFDIFRLHRWSGYLTLAAGLSHPVPLLFSERPRFRMVDVFLPLWSPKQPIEDTLGAVALYLLLLVIATSLYRVEIGRKLWKKLHYLTYAMAAALFFHAVFADPQLKTGRIDPLDGEKVLVEVCLLVVAAGGILRVRRASEKRERTRAALAEVPEAEG